MCQHCCLIQKYSRSPGRLLSRTKTALYHVQDLLDQIVRDEQCSGEDNYLNCEDRGSNVGGWVNQIVGRI